MTADAVPAHAVLPASHLDLLERPLFGHLRAPQVALSIHDPEQPYRYLEVRGLVEQIDPDPDGAFFDVLARRYGLPYTPPVGDAAHRVVLRVRPTGSSAQ